MPPSRAGRCLISPAYFSDVLKELILAIYGQRKTRAALLFADDAWPMPLEFTPLCRLPRNGHDGMPRRAKQVSSASSMPRIGEDGRQHNMRRIYRFYTRAA